MPDTTTRIRALNDRLRTTFRGGRVLITNGIDQLDAALKSAIFARVRAFQEFSACNDPYDEHDFGSIDIDGHKIFWKVDYYDPTLSAGSEDPADETKTCRVLTIMLAQEY